MLECNHGCPVVIDLIAIISDDDYKASAASVNVPNARARVHFESSVRRKGLTDSLVFATQNL